MSKTRGACHTPRLDPRPVYPPAGTVLWNVARNYGRDVAYGCLLVNAAAPLYETAYTA